jgi:hypothetical protein
MNVDMQMLSPIKYHYEYRKELVENEELKQAVNKIKQKYSSAAAAATALKEDREAAAALGRRH